ncbi:MAG: tRNA (adenosine(37)-N6)-threonylcarbamoyltransferase complex transferase subunit TsaD [Sebaldella sp.]|nr:tRNA (adenosine(37)-N6)-threonylcarbamoyltransferase complex transferase subunit TsaD [Sebaldella sp.]
MKILAIETSCDETSVAVIEDGKKILSNIVSSQIEIHEKYGGVVPEIASRHHIENILPVFKEALTEAKITIDEIDYIAVTYTPGLIGALLVGVSFAKALSYSKGIPLIPVHHLKGHVYSSFIEYDVELPAISLVVSGGHTLLIKIDEDHNFELIGETLDDAVGEVYDKVARLLGLGYPGGPKIDKLSDIGTSTLKIKKPNVKENEFSFSGIKTFVTNHIHNEKMKGNDIIKEDIAKSFQDITVKILCEKAINLCNKEDIKTLTVVGGVSANKALRKEMNKMGKENNIKVFFPNLDYCTDNAAMIGMAAYYEIKKKERDYNYILLDAVASKDMFL